MGMIALPAMLKRGYSKGLALGCILAGGGLGQLIPPAVMLIVYGLVANVSIGKLFAGGVGAGLLLASLYIGYIMRRSYFQPHLAPPPGAAGGAVHAAHAEDHGATRRDPPSPPRAGRPRLDLPDRHVAGQHSGQLSGWAGLRLEGRHHHARSAEQAARPKFFLGRVLSAYPHGGIHFGYHSE